MNCPMPVPSAKEGCASWVGIDLLVATSGTLADAVPTAQNATLPRHVAL
jgi:hypothetical protein